MRHHSHRNERGNALMITALAIFVLFAAIGMGIDLGRQQLLRARMQQASDASALAAASAPSGAQPKLVADRYFALNFPASYMGFKPAAPSVNISDTITVSTKGTTNTAMMGVMHNNSMNAAGSSTVTPGDSSVTQKYHVVLAMDNSFSMVATDVGASNTRPAGLSTQPLQKSQCESQWKNYVTAYGCTGLTTSTVPAFCSGGTPMQTCLSIQTQNEITSPNENGTINATRLNALRYAAGTIGEQLLTDNTAGSDVAGVRWASDLVGSATSPSSLAFTQNLSTLQNYLDGMYAESGVIAPGSGATNSTVGLNEAQRLLNPVLSQCGNTAVCAVVLITDGMNTIAGSPGAFGCDGTSYCQEAVTESLVACQKLKDEHVLVYTVAFGKDVTGSGAQATNARNFLQSCANASAGGTDYFLTAPDAATLTQKFQEIITTVKKVRIVR